MQKLSKKLVKKLIFEEISKAEFDKEQKTLTVRDEDGNVIDVHEDYPIERVEEDYPGLEITKEMIKNIVREEIQEFYGAK